MSKARNRRRTVKRSELSSLRMAAGNEGRIKAVIDNGEVKRWVGIGWIGEGPPTPRQKGLLPVVVD